MLQALESVNLVTNKPIARKEYDGMSDETHKTKQALSSPSHRSSLSKKGINRRKSAVNRATKKAKDLTASLAKRRFTMLGQINAANAEKESDTTQPISINIKKAASQGGS